MAYPILWYWIQMNWLVTDLSIQNTRTAWAMAANYPIRFNAEPVC
jgi:hypothetical protein